MLTTGCALRCEEEDVTLTSDALNVLASVATSTTLRYAFNLISCAQMIARKRKVEDVDVEGLRRAYTYSMDEKRSVQWLKEQQGSLVFEEIAISNGGAEWRCWRCNGDVGNDWLLSIQDIDGSEDWRAQELTRFRISYTEVRIQGNEQTGPHQLSRINNNRKRWASGEIDLLYK